MNDVKWITKNGNHIPITNEYMNDKIRNNYKIKEKPEKGFRNMYTMTLYDNKNEAGHLEYQKDNDEIIVDAIYTEEKYRRKGVATNLLKELKNKFGDRVYKFQAVLEDGEKLLKSKTDIIKKDDYGNYYVKIK